MGFTAMQFVDSWTRNPNRYDVLWAFYCVVLSWRALLICFQTSAHLGPLLHAIQLMFKVVLRFAVVFVMVTIGFIFGIKYIYSGSDTYSATRDEQGLYTFTYVHSSIEFLLESALGAREFEGIDEELLGQNYVIATTFLMLWLIVTVVILLNLLIALMTTEYDAVKQLAREEAAFLSAQNCYDLKHRLRFMPPPFNWLPVVVTLVVTLFNFIPALISPNYLNIYAYLHTKVCHHALALLRVAVC